VRINFHSIPGYTEAVQEEQRLRDRAYLDLPRFIAGIRVRPLTIELFNRLDAAGSAFVHGRSPTAGDVAVFLWIVSYEWREIRTWRDRLVRWRFFRKIREHKFCQSVLAIDEYIVNAYMDAPAATGKSDPGRKKYTSWNAVLIDEFAATYGWSIKEIQSIPLDILFQQFFWIRKKANPKALGFNRKSDRIIADWMKARRDKRAADRAKTTKTTNPPQQPPAAATVANPS
jgi:hypothetical protein